MSEDQPTPEDKPETEQARRKKQLVKAGVAAGIGSAAIVAALLYAKSTRRNQD